MDLKEYFEHTRGTGVFATSDADGNVDAAIYARPHILDEDQAAFIMTDRRTHDNLQSNPHAMFLFMEEGAGYRGKRLALTKVSEESDQDVIESLRRRHYPPEQEARMKPLFLVYFRVDEERPLVGDVPQVS